MKRIFGIFLCAAFVFALSANLFAEGAWYTNEDLKNKAVIDFRPSNNVSVYYEAGAPADNASDYQEYTAGTKHTGGDTVYGSSSGDSNIYRFVPSDGEDYRGQATPNVPFPTAGESDFEGEGWDKL